LELLGSEVKVGGYTRKKVGRKPLPGVTGPREEKIYDLTEEERYVLAVEEERPCIGREETEELDIVPAQGKGDKACTYEIRALPM